MKSGTKSVLYGAHCLLIHPFFVALAWIKLFGFPWDPRVWIAFLVHDLGYWGKPNMDGKEGETHPEFGAKIMHLFDGIEIIKKEELFPSDQRLKELQEDGWIVINAGNNAVTFEKMERSTKWQDFTQYHSRHTAKNNNAKPSKLCFADKMAFFITPRIIYIPMATLTGEILEYMRNSRTYKHMPTDWKPNLIEKLIWHERATNHTREWVKEHIDGRTDSWTERNRNTIGDPLELIREDTFSNEEINEMTGRMIRGIYATKQQ